MQFGIWSRPRRGYLIFVGEVLKHTHHYYPLRKYLIIYRLIAFESPSGENYQSFMSRISRRTVCTVRRNSPSISDVSSKLYKHSKEQPKNIFIKKLSIRLKQESHISSGTVSSRTFMCLEILEIFLIKKNSSQLHRGVSVLYQKSVVV